MRTSRHVFHTWLLALLLFPLAGWVSSLLMYGGAPTEGLLLFFVLGAVFSLPALLLCLIFFKPLMRTVLRVEIKLLLWLMLASACIIATVALLSLLFFGTVWLDADLLRFTAAAIAAAMLSILVRVRAFLRLFIFLVTEKNFNQPSTNHSIKYSNEYGNNY